MLLFLLACTGADPGDTDKPALDDTATTPEDEVDLDGDGYGPDLDCDDSNASVHPNGAEYCNDVDDDCDGEVDEDPFDGLTGYADLDADGFGDDTVTQSACTLPEGYVEEDGDCDDADATIHPGAAESCRDLRDRNCDGSVSFVDEDGDGWPACLDCDDTNTAIQPDADELCDLDDVDEDCDGFADDADDDALGTRTTYADADHDGYGDPADVLTACEPGVGRVFNADDCDDTNVNINPDALEACDLSDVDEDCNGLADDDDVSADGQTTWYTDDDGDGYGTGTSVLACDAPVGTAIARGDCDDAQLDVHPNADEVCDTLDNDCDGAADSDDTSVIDVPTWYEDADGDGYGGTTGVTDCNAPAGYVANTDDCDDTNIDVNPTAPEVSGNEVDEDCDTATGP